MMLQCIKSGFTLDLKKSLFHICSIPNFDHAKTFYMWKKSVMK